MRKIFLLLPLLLCLSGGMFAQVANNKQHPEISPGYNQTVVSGGTLLYKQDFGGNEVSDPLRPSVSPLTPEQSDLTLGDGQGYYTLAKEYGDGTDYTKAFYYFEDHTFPNDPTRGYLLKFDPAEGQANIIVYQESITDLCPGSTVIVSLWVGSLNGRSIFTGLVSPAFEIQLLSLKTNTLLASTDKITLPIISTTCTPIPCGTEGNNQWLQYYVNVTIPIDENGILFKVINREDGTTGNDWVLDDIEVRLMSGNADIQLNNTTDVSHNLSSDAELVSLKSTYLHNGTFSSPIYSTWLYSADNSSDMNDWTVINRKNENVSQGDNYDHHIDFSNAKPGYYQRIIGSQIESYKTNCKAATNVINVTK